MTTPDIRETDHPLWIWTRGYLWGAAGVVVMLALLAALFLFGPKDMVLFLLLLTASFLLATLLIAYAAYKMSGKKRTR